jgi:release factor glutamine methyltransferase
MTIALRAALAQSGLVPIDAQVLLAHVLGRDRAWLAAHATDPLSREDAQTFFELAKRRRDGEPVAYLTGVREFWGLALTVARSVLIPRPETETLVEVALAQLPADRDLRVLDLGTGSGAIALAIAHERPRARVIATDTSAAALAIARSNVERLLIGNVELVQSDWYESIAVDERFDAILSNPPYVAAHDPHLGEGDVRFEPRAALVSGASGLDALRAIAGGARERLVDGGLLAVEHGYDQADAVRALLERAGFGTVTSARDLAGIPRVAVARLVPP